MTFTPLYCILHSFHSPSYDHIASSEASSQNAIECALSQFPISSRFLNVYSSCLCLLPCLPVSSIFPPITCFRRQFLFKKWPIQLAFFLFTVCNMFSSSMTLCHPSSFPTRSVQAIFSILLQHHISKLSKCF